MQRMHRLSGRFVVIAVFVGAAATILTGCDNLIDHMIERKLTSTDYEILEDSGMHVIMAGTGSPRLDPKRGPACVAVIAGGEFMLFDAGEACIRRLEMMDLPIDRIGTIFITHLHSDHFAGLGQALNHSWIYGRTNKVEVYGPEGIDGIVDGIAMTYGTDIGFRSRNTGVMDPDHAVANANPVPLEGHDAVTVFERNGVVVTFFPVDHEPVLPAFGCRIEYKGRSVVISGDTRRCDSVSRHAKGADLLIHEAMNKEMVERAARVFEKLGRKTRAEHTRKVMHYHSDTIDAARVASEAGVNTLVLTHIIPPLPNAISEWMFTRGMSDYFDGKIILAEDGTRFYLEPKD